MKDYIKTMDNLSKGIRIELFNELEKNFCKGFDDFSNCWTIDIEKYNEIKKRYLEWKQTHYQMKN